MHSRRSSALTDLSIKLFGNGRLKALNKSAGKLGQKLRTYSERAGTRDKEATMAFFRKQ